MSVRLRAALFIGAVLSSPPALAQPAAFDPPADAAEESEEIVVEATRSGRRVRDEAIRVEVIDREEIEEKMLMRPGSIAMLLSETPGVRVQVVSPSLAGSNIRVQGLKGRYTQLLADGLPLFGGQVPAIGLLQIPPTDLGRVEVIKGAASAFYGPAALGGVINLIARRPGEVLAGDALANVTSRNGQDLTAFISGPIGEGLGASATGGGHLQTRRDLDRDGWADIPRYDRVTARPRLHWEGDSGARALLTLGLLRERRQGGTLPGRVAPDGLPFVEALDTDRIDAGLSGSAPIAGLGTLQLRSAAVTQRHRHGFGPSIEPDRHLTAFGETSLAGGTPGTTWVAGAAVQLDRYRSRAFPAFDYDYWNPAFFVQGEQTLGGVLTVAASARLDAHSEYGTRLSPRLSVLGRPGRWTLRGSIGRGFFAPTPFVEEIEAAGLSRLEPLTGLKAETATIGSFDIGYAAGGFEVNASLFGSDIRRAVQLRTIAPTRVRLVNAAGPTRAAGGEMLVRYRWRAFALTGSYTHVHTREDDPSGIGRRKVPRTPRSAAGLVATWERADRGRIGIEAYYTGQQRLDDNPYRMRSRRYVELGAMGEIVIGRARLFLNAENILNVRQTRWNPLVRPSRAADGRWTVDAWAPTEGFVVNGGARVPARKPVSAG